MGGKSEISGANGLVHDEAVMEEGRCLEKSSTPRDNSGMLTIQFAQKVSILDVKFADMLTYKPKLHDENWFFGYFLLCISAIIQDVYMQVN